MAFVVLLFLLRHAPYTPLLLLIKRTYTYLYGSLFFSFNEWNEHEFIRINIMTLLPFGNGTIALSEIINCKNIMCVRATMRFYKLMHSVSKILSLIQYNNLFNV